MTLASSIVDTVTHWGSVSFSEKEIPLPEVLDSIRDDDGRFVLKKSRQYSNNLVLWDNETNDIATITYAFIVRYATPIQTGNFVPEGKALPEGMMDYLRKSEPSNMAQISVTFDVRMDDGLLEMITTLEDWILAQPQFDPGQRPRNPWMSPTYIANNMKFTVASQLFQSKNAFNCKDGTYKVDYPVHPWIAENCVPHNPLWIPNPNVVQFYNVEDMKLQRMVESNEPELQPGDVVKMSTKLIVYSGRDTWTASFVPWQILRVGKLDRVDIGPAVQVEDHRPSFLPKEGETLNVMTTRREGQREPAKAKKTASEEESAVDSPYPLQDRSKPEEPARTKSNASEEESTVDLSDISQQASGSGGEEAEHTVIKTEKSVAKQKKMERPDKTEGMKRKAEEDLESKKRITKPRSAKSTH